MGIPKIPNGDIPYFRKTDTDVGIWNTEYRLLNTENSVRFGILYNPLLFHQSVA